MAEGLRELSAGIYNVLNYTSRRHLSVKQFVDAVNSSDAGMEANLSAALQSVRGTEQFWFLKKSDVTAMIREFRSPTLFLTLSCAEYQSADIERYLQKVNEVTESYLLVDYVQKIQFLCHKNFHRSLGNFSRLCCCKVKY